MTYGIGGLTVTLTASPCYTALTAAASAPANPTIAYDYYTTTETIGDWSTFVDNNDPTNCAVTSCVIKA